MVLLEVLRHCIHRLDYKMIARKISTTSYPILFYMVQTDHITPKTGANPSVQLSKNGAAFASAAGTTSEISDGWYSLSGNAIDRNTLGTLLLKATASGADTAFVQLSITSYDPYDVVGAVWDEELTGATHNIPTSSGRRLRTIAATSIISGVVVSAGNNTCILDAGASSIDGAYDPALLFIDGGTGAGQSRLILEYKGSTKTCIVDRDWKTIPDNTSSYQILADAGREHVNEGLARGATANTIVLNAGASNNDNDYIGQIIFIRSGQGQDQARKVISYTAATKTATVEFDWYDIPDTTSAYVMLPTGGFNENDLVEDIWGNATRTLTQSAVIPAASTEAGNIITIRGDTQSKSITGLGPLNNYSALYFTAKLMQNLADAAACIQIVKKSAGTDGLIYLVGKNTYDTSWANIAIDDINAGNITINIKADAMALIDCGTYYYDIQIVRSTGSPVYTMASGLFTVVFDITRAIT